ncbi:hypothetical protein ABPG74_004885 [Tetrahymena malaccensis]
MKGMLDEIIKSHSHSQVLKGTLAYYGYDEKGLTRIERDFNCRKMKLLGGSQRFKDHTINKKNDHSLNKQKISQEIQCNQNLNEDKYQNQEGVQNNIKTSFLNSIHQQMNDYQLNSDKMVIEELNDKTINKKYKSQKIQNNQNLDDNNFKSQLGVENNNTNNYLNGIYEQILFKANSGRKKNQEEQQNQIVNAQNQSKQAQYNQNQNEDRNIDDKMEIKEQQNSSFCQQLQNQIQKIIDIFDLMCTAKKDPLISNKVTNQICHNDCQIQNCKFKEKQKQPILNENYKIQLEDLITQTGNRKKTLQEQDLTFLKSIFKLDHYITSGGEADIFVNVQQQVAFRVIKIDDKALKNNLSELHNVKQFLEGHYVLDFQTSHLIENKLNEQKYIIHVMQICQSSLQSEYKKIEEYSLGQILNIIFTCLHFLIQLRQKYIYHSDIKLANILKINDQYKLSDFGASIKINFNYPYTNTDMYTPHYYPKKEFNQNLPFYHDIYSVAKTIDFLLNKLSTHLIIKKQLKKQIQELLKDDENSVQIDCFLLPQKFIDCLLIDKIQSETKEFLERYLENIKMLLNAYKKL